MGTPRALPNPPRAARAGLNVRQIPSGVDGKRVADGLRFQVTAGRVRRVSRGVYQLDPSTMSASTRWRSLNWQRVQRNWWLAPKRDGAHDSGDSDAFPLV
jgi:hypothetical protein